MTQTSLKQNLSYPAAPLHLHRKSAASRLKVASPGRIGISIAITPEMHTWINNVSSYKKISNEKALEQILMVGRKELNMEFTLWPNIPDFKISPMEMKVLSILIQGRQNKEISNQLGITERTIKFHMTQLLKKTKTGNRVKLAKWAATYVIKSRENLESQQYLDMNISPPKMNVLYEVAKAKCNKEIAAHLNISKSTVQFHIHDLLAITGTKDKTQLLLWAVNNVPSLSMDRAKEATANSSKLQNVKINPREMEVLNALVHGKGSREIAQELDIKRRTVNFHRSNLLRRTKTENRMGLVLWGVNYMRLQRQSAIKMLRNGETLQARPQDIKKRELSKIAAH